ncbi:hypothetical protein SLEP1_g53408 [Rubroshorea leprosula]|uniref:Uncharacterized protein n=1 Tax=Rubroshorea leprosula TaxID=152421 RepID=A0AAV5MD76_9ROSI|nr:hypothetical protein SLEP1_g53408 [Rubroshorea leprosula]
MGANFSDFWIPEFPLHCRRPSLSLQLRFACWNSGKWQLHLIFRP